MREWRSIASRSTRTCLAPDASNVSNLLIVDGNLCFQPASGFVGNAGTTGLVSENND
jgi:hypothetical protein